MKIGQVIKGSQVKYTSVQGLRDWSLITGREATKRQGRLPLRKKKGGGVGKGFSHAEGGGGEGTQSFGLVFT